MKVFDMFPNKKDNFFCRKKAVTNIFKSHSPNLTTAVKSKQNIRCSVSSSIDKRHQSFQKQQSIISETDKPAYTSTYNEIPGRIKKIHKNDFSLKTNLNTKQKGRKSRPKSTERSRVIKNPGKNYNNMVPGYTDIKNLVKKDFSKKQSQTYKEIISKVINNEDQDKLLQLLNENGLMKNKIDYLEKKIKVHQTSRSRVPPHYRKEIEYYNDNKNSIFSTKTSSNIKIINNPIS